MTSIQSPIDVYRLLTLIYTVQSDLSTPVFRASLIALKSTRHNIYMYHFIAACRPSWFYAGVK